MKPPEGSEDPSKSGVGPIRPDFYSWALQDAASRPEANIEDQLSRYIEKYDLCIRKFLDEPSVITHFRTKLSVLLECDFLNKVPRSPQIKNFFLALSGTLKAYDEGSDELKEKLKKQYGEGQK